MLSTGSTTHLSVRCLCPFPTSQDAVGCVCCQGHAAGSSCSLPRLPGSFLQSYSSVSQSVSPQPILPPRTLPSQLQDFVFILVKFHKVLVCPFLQLIMVSLNGRAALKHIGWSSQFHGICRLEKSALHDWSLAKLNETCPRIDPCTILLATRLHVESDLIRFLLIWQPTNPNCNVSS